MGVAQCGRQVHPDQTKAVKGQDRKTLATADTIKRPLPCPIERIKKKTEIFLRSEREKKKQSKKKRKKIRTKTKKKRKETKKEKES